MANSYFDSSARERLLATVDAGTFHEFLPPSARVASPHLRQLDQPVAFDDGIVIGSARLGITARTSAESTGTSKAKPTARASSEPVLLIS